LKGTQFHGWTVIKKCDEVTGTRASYICKCECGLIKPVIASRLIYGLTKRCRTCSNKIINKKAVGRKRLNRIGEKYGKWKVVDFVGLKPRFGNEYRPVYKIRCECGFEIIMKQFCNMNTRAPKCHNCYKGRKYHNSMIKNKDYSGVIIDSKYEGHKYSYSANDNREVIKNYTKPIKGKSPKSSSVDSAMHDRLIETQREQNNYDVAGEYTMAGLLMGWKKK